MIVCYVTGLGAVDPPVPTGQSAPLDVLSRATALVSATIGDAPATVDFAGLAPTFVGLGQINVTVPDGAASGAAIPLIIEVAGQNSQTATISIR